MSDLKFNCPHCEEHLKAPEDMIGETIDCSFCGGSIELCDPETADLPPPGPRPQTKDCPYCGEEILAKAKKCKHCGEMLDAALKKQSRKSQQPAQKGEGCFLQGMNCGCIIIVIIIVVNVLIMMGFFSAALK